ncbi:uncharacterized protein AKAW2_80109A [Aspergillus luchuensis]|uniref:Uncharacterized protein n=1 Tax=Aspergillus kawachii TaxID=1069201 RepID=A0A7R7WJT9_ASPKA|nr:uncharacterized protein AKAW2_80109A [Aspergillus luchuensis]BCS04308.1 hypothetical protein AKAW2_80109A [Aspergillus luchuensis]
MVVAGGIESIQVADMLYVVMINISLRQKLWLDFLIQPNWKLEARHVSKISRGGRRGSRADDWTAERGNYPCGKRVDADDLGVIWGSLTPQSCNDAEGDV